MGNLEELEELHRTLDSFPENVKKFLRNEGLIYVCRPPENEGILFERWKRYQDVKKGINSLDFDYSLFEDITNYITRALSI